MPQPPITHLQAAALDLISNEIRGRELREKLAKLGFQQSTAAFYRLMARLEEMNLVSGSYENRSIAGQIVRERKYKVRAAGVRAVEETRMFYANMNLGGRLDEEIVF